MADNLSSEEQTVLSTWKALLKRKGIKTGDNALCSMLLWAKSQDFETDASIAFSVRAWKKVGERLWDMVSNGDKVAADLATNWRFLYETLKKQKTEQDKKEQMERKSEQKIEANGEQQTAKVPLSDKPFPKVELAGAASTQAPQGSAVMGNKQQADNASQYLSPKDCVKPVYPSPVQQLAELGTKLKYITPAQQLAEMTFKKETSGAICPTAPLRSA